MKYHAPHLKDYFYQQVKRNQYSVNYHIAQYQNIISELRQEILRLKTKLMDNDLKSQQSKFLDVVFIFSFIVVVVLLILIN